MIDNVLPARIRACEARPGLVKCWFRKTAQRAFQRFSARPTPVLRNPGDEVCPRRSPNRLLYEVVGVHHFILH